MISFRGTHWLRRPFCVMIDFRDAAKILVDSHSTALAASWRLSTRSNRACFHACFFLDLILLNSTAIAIHYILPKFKTKDVQRSAKTFLYSKLSNNSWVIWALWTLEFHVSSLHIWMKCCIFQNYNFCFIWNTNYVCDLKMCAMETWLMRTTYQNNLNTFEISDVWD